MAPERGLQLSLSRQVLRVDDAGYSGGIHGLVPVNALNFALLLIFVAFPDAARNVRRAGEQPTRRHYRANVTGTMTSA
jgi:hypothetical protein